MHAVHEHLIAQMVEVCIAVLELQVQDTHGATFQLIVTASHLCFLSAHYCLISGANNILLYLAGSFVGALRRIFLKTED